MEKIMIEIRHICAKTKSIIDSYSRQKNASGSSSKAHSDGESSRRSLEPEHQATAALRAEWSATEKNEEHSYWSAVTSSGDLLVASQSIIGAEELQQSDKKIVSSSYSFQRTVSDVNRKNFLDLVATKLEKLRKIVVSVLFICLAGLLCLRILQNGAVCRSLSFEVLSLPFFQMLLLGLKMTFLSAFGRTCYK